MKKNLITLLLIASSSLTIAQNKFEKAMTSGMEILKTAKNSTEFLDAANHFERIAKVENKEWTPMYWASYSTMFAAMYAENDDRKDELYDKANSMLSEIEKSNVNQSEYYTLKGYIALMKIAVSPMVRSAMGTGDAMELIEKAKKLNPNNPRPFYVQAQHLFYTPSFFGGGKSVSKPLLTTSLNNYAKETPSNSFEPRWGKARAEYLLKKCDE